MDAAGALSRFSLIASAPIPQLLWVLADSISQFLSFFRELLSVLCKPLWPRVYVLTIQGQPTAKYSFTQTTNG